MYIFAIDFLGIKKVMINTREDWIKAGFEILKTKGVSGVKVEVLARELGVTKGGFYGYFLNREAFLQAMLDYWADTLTNQIIKSIGNLSGTLPEKLQKLLHTVDTKKFDDTERPMFSWAILDPKAEKVIMGAIKERLEFITNLFIEEDFSKEEAERRANIVHHFMAGCRSFRAISPPSGSLERHAQLDHFVRLVTAPQGKD